MFDVIRALEADAVLHRKFEDLIAASSESRKVRMQERALTCLELLLKENKISPTVLQMVMKEAPVRQGAPTQPLAPPKPEPPKAEDKSVAAFIEDGEDDDSEEG